MKNKGISYLEIIFSIIIISILSAAIFNVNSSNRRISNMNLKTLNSVHELFNYLECFEVYKENPILIHGFKIEKKKIGAYDIIFLRSKKNENISFVSLKRSDE